MIRSDFIWVTLAFILLMSPLCIYSTVMDNNNLTANNTTLLNVPDVRQTTDYSCGPTSLQAVLSYYGSDMRMDQLINMTNSTENGTSPDNIAGAARQMGFSAEIKENMTLQDLQKSISRGIPVIIDCQAWSGNNTTNQNWTADQEDGHYMVVIGIDDTNIYFEDPAILGSRGYLSNQEFLDRWHDLYLNPKTGNNTTTNHLGIIITGKEPLSRVLFMKIG